MRAPADGVTVRRMRAEDYDGAWRAILDGDWGDRRLELRFYLGFPSAALFVAEAADGAIVGTATAIQHGVESGWIGLVFVAPALRGRGFGRVLTEAALHHLEERGCERVLLAASELGLPIYARLGFQPVGGYTVLSGPLMAPAHAIDSSVRSLRHDDLSAVAALDRQANGEDRHALIETLLALGHPGWVVGDASDLRGYALRTPWGFGPVVASTPGEAHALLESTVAHSSASGTVTVTVPTQNVLARDYLRRRGLAEQRSLPRMILGPPGAWQPNAIWSIFNFALG